MTYIVAKAIGGEKAAGLQNPFLVQVEHMRSIARERGEYGPQRATARKGAGLSFRGGRDT